MLEPAAELCHDRFDRSRVRSTLKAWAAMHLEMLWFLIAPVAYIVLESPRIYHRKSAMRSLAVLLTALLSLGIAIFVAEIFIQDKSALSQMPTHHQLVERFWGGVKAFNLSDWFWIVASQQVLGAVIYVVARPVSLSSSGDDINDQALGLGAKLAAILTGLVLARIVGTYLYHVWF